MGKNNFSDQSYELMLGSLFGRVSSFQEKGAAAYRPGLERVERMCAILGNPQKKFRCIHVAGTNGKGSVCNMLTAQMAFKGFRTGLYTSPHLLDFRERMRIVSADGVEFISREEVWDFLTGREAVLDELSLSLFEITTVMAFDFFASRAVDVAVIETGLGGRLDATNIINPCLSVITNIGYDHMDILGDTLDKIAGEKAGIIKPGVPVVVGERNPQTDSVFIRAAAQKGSPLFFAGDAVTEKDFRQFEPLLSGMDLRGSYQRCNLRTALCALSVLGDEPSTEAFLHTARICDFHARWEIVRDNPLTICDIGHNAHGLKYNFAQLVRMKEEGEVTDLVLVYGSVRDKDVDAVLRLLPSEAYVYCTQAPGERALPAGEILGKCAALGRTACIEAVPDVGHAVAAATQRCRTIMAENPSSRPLLYIGGSTYVVAEAMKFL